MKDLFELYNLTAEDWRLTDRFLEQSQLRARSGKCIDDWLFLERGVKLLDPDRLEKKDLIDEHNALLRKLSLETRRGSGWLTGRIFNHESAATIKILLPKLFSRLRQPGEIDDQEFDDVCDYFVCRPWQIDEMDVSIAAFIYPDRINDLKLGQAQIEKLFWDRRGTSPYKMFFGAPHAAIGYRLLASHYNINLEFTEDDYQSCIEILNGRKKLLYKAQDPILQAGAAWFLTSFAANLKIISAKEIVNTKDELKLIT